MLSRVTQSFIIGASAIYIVDTLDNLKTVADIKQYLDKNGLPKQIKIEYSK